MHEAFGVGDLKNIPFINVLFVLVIAVSVHSKVTSYHNMIIFCSLLESLQKSCDLIIVCMLPVVTQKVQTKDQLRRKTLSRRNPKYP